jgi:6-phosphogluconolactonase
MNQDRSDANGTPAAVYAQTNDAGRNQVIAYRRAQSGELSPLGVYDTGGRGSGKPHLASQSSVVLSGDGRRLFVANAGSDEVSAFAVGRDSLELTDRVASGGNAPTSIAARGGVLYVLNAGSPANISGFTVEDDGRLSPLAGSTRGLSEPDADPAQLSFSPDGKSLVATERATDSISVYSVGEDGLADGPTVHPSSGQTPYGFDFTRSGALFVTEAAGARIGEASASSYLLSPGAGLAPLTGPVGNTRSEVCWATISKDDRYAFVTNFGDGSISAYAIDDDGRIELLDPVAATTVDGQKGIRDEALSGDGRYLYALHADLRKVFGWEVGDEGSLSPIGAFGDLPETVAGLAAV